MNFTCSTLLCGAPAKWRFTDTDHLGNPKVVYKCETCFERNRSAYLEDKWELVFENPAMEEIRASLARRR